MARRKALFSAMNANGLGYLVDASSHSVLSFTLNKIPEYHGEAVEQILVNRGDVVEYELDNAGHVGKVFLAIPQDLCLVGCRSILRPSESAPLFNE